MSQEIYVIIRHESHPKICYSLSKERALRLAGLPTSSLLQASDLDGHPSISDDDGNNHVVMIVNTESDYDGESSVWIAQDSDGSILTVTADLRTIDFDNESITRLELISGADQN